MEASSRSQACGFARRRAFDDTFERGSHVWSKFPRGLQDQSQFEDPALSWQCDAMRHLRSRRTRAWGIMRTPPMLSYSGSGKSSPEDCQGKARSRGRGRSIAMRWICCWIMAASSISTAGAQHIHDSCSIPTLTDAPKQARGICAADPTRIVQSRVKFVAISQFCFHTLRESFWGGRSACGCTYPVPWSSWFVFWVGLGVLICVCVRACVGVCVYRLGGRWYPCNVTVVTSYTIYISICGGSPGSLGGRWPTKTPPGDPCKRTRGTVVTHPGAIVRRSWWSP